MKKTPKILPTYYKSKGTPIFRDTTALPFAQGGTLDSSIAAYNSDPGKGKKGKKSKKVKPFVTSDYDEYLYRKAAYDDSSFVANKYNPIQPKTPKYEVYHIAGKAGLGKRASVKKGFESANSHSSGFGNDDYGGKSPAWKKFREENMHLRDRMLTNKPIGYATETSTYHSHALPTPFGLRTFTLPGHSKTTQTDSEVRFQRPVQPVKFVKPVPDKTKPNTNKKVISKPKQPVTEESIPPTPIPEKVIPTLTPTPIPIPPGPLTLEPLKGYPGIMPVYDIDDTPIYATPDPHAEWIGQTERYIDWNANRIPYRLPRFRQPGHGGDLIKPGKRRYIPIPGIETRHSAYIQKEGESTEEYGKGGTIHFEPSEYGSDAREHYADGGPIYTYSKRPGSFYQRAADGSWMISNSSTKGEYVPINDPTGKRSELLNKNAVVYNAPVQGAPKPVINQAVWNKAQQQGEDELAAKQIVANIHKQSGTSGLYMPDGSLRPQAAQAADWVPQAMIAAPIALEALGTAAATEIPFTGGVNLGGIANATGLVHGATEIDDRYKDWQNVAKGQMDWKEAALKTGLTGLEFAGAGIPVKNASNALKAINAPKSKGIVLPTSTATKKVVGMIDEFGDVVDDVYKFPIGESVPINANKTANAIDLSNQNRAIDLDAWKKAQGQAEVNNWRFVIPRQEEEFLAAKYAQEFSDKYGIPLDKLTSHDVALYGKMREAQFLPTREVIPASKQLGGNVKELHENFVKQHTPQYSLNPQEELAVDAYTRGFDSIINARQPSRAQTFYDQEVSPILEQTILQNKFKSPTTLVRGSEDFDIAGRASVVRGGQPVENLKFSQLQEGDIFSPGSFTSTKIAEFSPNLQETPLSGFTRKANNLDYVINAPKGQSFLYPNATNIQNYIRETEAVLPNKLQFKLDKVVSDLERGYLGTPKDIQRGVQYGIGDQSFTRVPNKILPSFKRFDRIQRNVRNPETGELMQIRIPNKSVQNLIDYHNRTHTPTIPKYYFSILNPYLFGGKLNKNY